MGVVSCPECGKEISSIAEHCPQCGFPFALFRSSPLHEGNSYVRVASNYQTPALLLFLLSQNEDWEIRAAVAKNPSAPPFLLQILSEDNDEDVRAAVAENGGVPVAILENLAGDESAKVLTSVAGNLGAPERILACIENRIVLGDCSDDLAGHDDCDGCGSYGYDCYDDPADCDDLVGGYYRSASGDFYVNESGERCSVMDTSDEGGMLMYYDEGNGCWLEC